MKVNLKCGACSHIYDYDVGEPSLDKNHNLVFANSPICPKCKAKDKELLSELGQSQMTDWYLSDT